MIDIIPGVSFSFPSRVHCVHVHSVCARPAGRAVFLRLSFFFKVLMWVRMIRSRCTVCRVAAALTTACATVHAHILHPTEVWS